MQNVVHLSYADPENAIQIPLDPITHHATLEEENRALKLENVKLKMEAAMLKRATVYFASLHK